MIAQREKGWIGVDVGTHSIKLAQLERCRGELRPVASAVVPRLDALPVDDQRSSLESMPLADEVRCALDLCPRFRGRNAGCILSMACQDLRILSLPPGNEQERHAMIGGELLAGGGSLDGRQFDYWEAFDGGSTSTDVYVLSISQGLARQAARDLRRAGLECHVIDGPPFTMARATSAKGYSSHGIPVGIIDWGYSSTTFCLAVDGRPRYCRAMRNCSIRDILEPIQRGLSINTNDQHHLLTHYGLPDVSEQDPSRQAIQKSIGDLVSSVLTEFCDQLEKTITFLQTHQSEIAPGQVWLSGGGAIIPNVLHFLADKLNVPIHILGLNAFHDGESWAELEAPYPLLSSALALSALRWEQPD